MLPQIVRLLLLIQVDQLQQHTIQVIQQLLRITPVLALAIRLQLRMQQVIQLRLLLIRVDQLRLRITPTIQPVLLR